jgi:membrane-bound lytic murein transglycosylase
MHMKNNNKTKRILVETGQISGQNISMKHLEHLPETMPNRVQAIIESKGWYTPY